MSKDQGNLDLSVHVLLLFRLQSKLFPFFFSRAHPPLSPTENGGELLKNRVGETLGSWKLILNLSKLIQCCVFILTILCFTPARFSEKSRDIDPPLIDYLAANGFDLLTHSHTPPEKSAAVALDEGQCL